MQPDVVDLNYLNYYYVTWNNLSLKYQRLTPSGCIDIGIRKLEFVIRTQLSFFQHIWDFMIDQIFEYQDIVQRELFQILKLCITQSILCLRLKHIIGSSIAVIYNSLFIYQRFSKIFSRRGVWRCDSFLPYTALQWVLINKKVLKQTLVEISLIQRTAEQFLPKSHPLWVTLYRAIYLTVQRK